MKGWQCDLLAPAVLLLTFLLHCTAAFAFDSSEIRFLEEQNNKRQSSLIGYYNDAYLPGEMAQAKRSAHATSPIIRFGKRSPYSTDTIQLTRQLRTVMMDPLIRFGKRTPGMEAPLIRFGKRTPGMEAPLIRFGKRASASGSAFSTTPHIRFGKRSPQQIPYMEAPHFAANEPFNRILRRANPVVQEDTILRFG